MILLIIPRIAFASVNSNINSEISNPIILILGDSLSAAHGIDPKEGWVALLEEKLIKNGYSYSVINSSISGDTTSNGKTRIFALYQEYKPAILILGLGSNDGLRGLSPLIMKQNLKDIINTALQHHTKVLLVGFLIPKNYGEAYREKFEKVYDDLSKEFQLPRVPFLLEKVALNPDLMQSDGLHPNTEAQSIILENVWIYLKPMLKSMNRLHHNPITGTDDHHGKK